MKDSDETVVIHGLVCPKPLTHKDTVVLAHGSGGKLTRELIEGAFYPPFKNPILLRGDDAAVLSLPQGGEIAVSTDSHIVSPLFFPGGDIGRLSVCGTVNDLTMVGAQPRWLTAGFILEEGLPVYLLRQVLESMKAAAAEAGIEIVAGDTKVVESGKGDGLFINTSGVGWIPNGRRVHGAGAQAGDAVLLSGSLGDHGIAVLAARGELEFETEVGSDIAPLNGAVERLFQAGIDLHAMRDPTRGGLATALNEISRQSGVAIHLEEEAIPVRPEVEAACEMLGFDPLYVANEGKFVACLPAGQVEEALRVLRDTEVGEGARLVGEVRSAPKGRVLMHTSIGGTRVVDSLVGEMLPRIC